VKIFHLRPVSLKGQKKILAQFGAMGHILQNL